MLMSYPTAELKVNILLPGYDNCRPSAWGLSTVCHSMPTSGITLHVMILELWGPGLAQCECVIGTVRSRLQHMLLMLSIRTRHGPGICFLYYSPLQPARKT